MFERVERVGSWEQGCSCIKGQATVRMVLFSALHKSGSYQFIQLVWIFFVKFVGCLFLAMQCLR